MRRVTFTISDETFEVVKDLAQKTDSPTTADLIRKAIKAYKILNDERLAGNSIISRDNRSKKEKEFVGY